MHTLKNWTAKRSGPQITVSGYSPADRLMERRLKFSVVEVQGPCAGRMLSPASSIGVQRDGSCIALI